jgi:DNA polymerase-3 subunit delta'
VSPELSSNANDAGARQRVGGWPAWADASAVAQLRENIRSGQITHAYLFTGPKGVGKAEVARSFAQALSCADPDVEDPSLPCGQCRFCRNVWNGAHPDVEMVSLESQAALSEKATRSTALTIETVRAMRASAALLPLEAARRVVIVEDAETLLEPAQQALLKTLEEPPAAVIYMLLSDETDALLDTVRSRCREVALRPAPLSSVVEALRAQGIGAEAAAEIAELSRGCTAWALSAAADATFLAPRREARERAIAWIRSTPYERLVTAYKLGVEFSARRTEVVGIVQAAAQVLRDGMIHAAGGQEPDWAIGSSAAGASPHIFAQALAATLQSLADLDGNVRPRLALETMVLTWPSMGSRQN